MLLKHYLEQGVSKPEWSRVATSSSWWGWRLSRKVAETLNACSSPGAVSVVMPRTILLMRSCECRAPQTSPGR